MEINKEEATKQRKQLDPSQRKMEDSSDCKMQITRKRKIHDQGESLKNTRNQIKPNKKKNRKKTKKITNNLETKNQTTAIKSL